MDTALEWLRNLYAIASHPLITLVLGALLGVYFSLHFKQPRLVARSGGRGHSTVDGTAYWGVTIGNRPMFFHKPLNGETAQRVKVVVELRAEGARGHFLSWGRNADLLEIDLAAGEEQQIKVFHWSKGVEGYCVHSSSGKPLARFRDPSAKFVLRMFDHLDRTTEIPFRVTYDGSNLEGPPDLHLHFPRTFRVRLDDIREGLASFRNAFRRTE